MNQKNTTLLLGGGFMFIGFILLFALLSKARMNDLIAAFWPLILLFFGLMLATTPGGSAHGIGWSMIWLGVIMILRRTGILRGDAGGTIMILLLVLTGLFIIAFSVKPTSESPQPSEDEVPRY